MPFLFEGIRDVGDLVLDYGFVLAFLVGFEAIYLVCADKLLASLSESYFHRGYQKPTSEVVFTVLPSNG